MRRVEQACVLIDVDAPAAVSVTDQRRRRARVRVLEQPYPAQEERRRVGRVDRERESVVADLPRPGRGVIAARVRAAGADHARPMRPAVEGLEDAG